MLGPESEKNTNGFKSQTLKGRMLIRASTASPKG